MADVPENCKNFAIKLEYDEELGCYTGTGVLGDALNPPKEFTVTCKIVAQGTDSGVFTRARNRTYYATYQVEVIDNWICSNGNIWINEVDIVE